MINEMRVNEAVYHLKRGQFVRSNEYCPKLPCRSQIAGYCEICLGTGFIYVRKDIMDTSILKNLDTSRFTLDEVMELGCAANTLSQYYTAHEIETPLWLLDAERKLITAINEKHKLVLMEKESRMKAEIDELAPKEEKRAKLKKDLAKLKGKLGNGNTAA
jgi:hypothetical protein